MSTLSVRSFVRSSGQLVSRSKDVVAATRKVADIVIIEAPPLLAYHHAEALAHAVDVVLVICEYRVTKSDEAKRVGSVLRSLGAPVLGVVFTDVPLNKNDSRLRLATATPVPQIESTPTSGPESEIESAARADQEPKVESVAPVAPESGLPLAEPQDQ